MAARAALAVARRVAVPRMNLGGARRCLNLHEVDSTEVMQEYGISTATGARAFSGEEAARVANKLSPGKKVVKAQVLAGGRGKGHFDNGFQGGVHIVDSPEEVKSVAASMIGHRLITKQTGEEGRPCNMVQVVEAEKIVKEVYFALLMDRTAMGPVAVASSQGGMDIEAVAENSPDAIVTTPIDITTGLTHDVAKGIAKQIGFEGESQDFAATEMTALYKLFSERDCTLVEINPMVQVEDGKVKCLDAKLNFDDNAAFRQKEIFARRDISQENAADVEAAKYDLNYIDLDGSIGCLVNGAGLAMATMDIIQLYGGKPANFLDVGGGATAEQVTAAFKLITSDQDVTAILVNIFGGIMRCDIIAEGIIRAASELNLDVPVIVRLQGTRRTEAKRLIEESGLAIISADDLDVAAQKAVAVSKINEIARQEGLRVSFDVAKEEPRKSDQVMTPL